MSPHAPDTIGARRMDWSGHRAPRAEADYERRAWIVTGAIVAVAVAVAVAAVAVASFVVARARSH
jgi:hypothetical protein